MKNVDVVEFISMNLLIAIDNLDDGDYITLEKTLSDLVQPLEDLKELVDKQEKHNEILKHRIESIYSLIAEDPRVDEALGRQELMKL